MLNSTATKLSYTNSTDSLDVNLKSSFSLKETRKNSHKAKTSISEQIHLPKNPIARHLFSKKNSIETFDISTKMHLVSFRNGDTVYEPDGKFDYIYLPETAVFSQLSILEDGRTVETALVGNEGIIGISALLGFNSTNLWTHNIVTGTAYKICTQFFKVELANDLLLQKLFYKFVNFYIKQITQRAVCNNHHRLDERFSSWLLSLEERITSVENNKIVLTQEQIAQILGVHRPSITCIAQQFRNSGIIDYLRGRIVILDRAKLNSAACECFSNLKLCI